MAVKLPDVSEFQSPASGNAPNWAGIKSQNGGAAIIRVGYGNAHLDGMLVSNRATIKSLKFGFCGLYQYLRAGQDVLSQAHAFINWIGPNLNEGEIPVLDLEEGSGDQSGRGRPEQLGDDRIQPGHLIPMRRGMTDATGDAWAHTGRDEASPRRVPALSAH